MDWQKLVLECLRDVRFEKAKKAKFNESQSDNLCRAFLAKLSKFCAVGWPAVGSPGPRIRRVSELPPGYDGNAKIVLQRAWKELYRVIREADIYLQACSGPEWWKKCVTIASTGEAHAIHIHDLLWCVVCLDLTIVLAAESSCEAYDAVCCRRMGEFGGEMTSPIRIHEEYVDKKQLVNTLQEIWHDYDKKNGLRRIILNSDEENKAHVAKFLAEKLLQVNIHTESRVTELSVPKWLQIDPRDLKRKNIVGLVDCNQICEGSWLGIKVGLQEIPSCAYGYFQKEAVVLTRLQSPFLVQFIGVCNYDGLCYIVMETVSSNLVKLLEERVSIPLHVGVDIMLQISRGMEYLHSQRIMHLDLKPSNILIEPSSIRGFRDEGHGRVKILNLGMAGLKLNCVSLKSSYSCWMAPEAYGYPYDQSPHEILKQCTYKADVYSFGMICYHILTGKQPFEAIPNSKLHTCITQGQRPVLPSSCPSLLADYINKCWDTDPARRPHFHDISKFLRYMKLVVMRIHDSGKCNSFQAVCREFDTEQIHKYFEGNIALSADERVTSEEEGLIIRALDGDFPESFRTLDGQQTININVPLAPKRTYSGRFLLRAQDTDLKYLVSLPAYIRKYSYEELQKATSGFNLRIANFCNSSSVWKAILPDRTHVAVKLIEKVNSENFRNEATVLAQLHHPNIIRLRGVCIGASNCLLVYDYMAMGSLEKRLFSTAGDQSAHQNHVLNWIMRRRIGLGLARGLAYLHQDCTSKFLNVKIDANNILLDERFTAKLCGFGLARVAEHIKPESQPNGSNNWLKKSEQEDEQVANVYSFGVVLLEILTGCRCIDTPFSDYYCLHETVHGIGSKGIMDFVDYRLRNEVGEKEARSVINLGLWCIMKDPSLRPSMNQAVLVMEGILELCPPPLGRMEILPPPLRSHHFLQYQRALLINNSNSNNGIAATDTIMGPDTRCIDE
eukprot:Gb_02017 [translate_table: standard]